MKIDELNVDFMEILSTQTTSGQTGAMMEVIERQISQIDGVVMEKDDFGNLYVTKGKSDTYPAFVSHTDTVHKIRDTYYVARSENGNYYAYTEDNGEFQQVGIGGDDKSGIILCIELLHRLKNVKCAFFLDEETGCNGSAAGNLAFFDDCRYAIQIDRKGNGDIITVGSGVTLGSDEFVQCMDTVGKKYGYKSTNGMMTDVVQLKKRGLGISVCNLSAAYYNPHTKQEYINENDLLNCLQFCLAFAKIKTVYQHKYVAPVYNTPAKKYQSSFGNFYKERSCIDCSTKLSAFESVKCWTCMRKGRTVELLDNGNKVLETSNAPCFECEQLPVYKDGVCIECYDSFYLCEECTKPLVDEVEFQYGLCTTCAETVLDVDDSEVCAICLKTVNLEDALSVDGEYMCRRCFGSAYAAAYGGAY